jgi:intein/homing endonuclease
MKESSKNIKEVNIETDQIRSLNSFSPVEEKKEFNIDEKIVELTTSKGSIKITKNHPVLVVNNEGDFTFEQIKNKLKAGTLKPEWIEAENLTKSHLIICSK